MMKRAKQILFITLLFFAGESAQILYAQSKLENVSSADSVKSGYTLENCINTFSPDKSVKTAAGYQYWFIDKELAGGKTLKLSVVVPNKATHTPHVHPEDEMFFILEGNAEVFLYGKWKAVSPNTSFYCPSNVEHGIRNAGDKELKYLVIKKY